MRPSVLPLALLLLAAAGCERSAPSGALGSGVATQAARDEAVSQAEVAAPAAAPVAPAPAPVAHEAVLSLAGAAGEPASTAMIIRSGTAAVEVDSLEPAIAALRALVARSGGYVGGTAVQGGAESERSATLELRVPADRFDGLVSGLSALGTVEWVNISAEDVGEQYVDLAARLANSERLETRLVELLASRTGKLADVLAVERELSRVREEIERIEGRMRYLRTRAATSVLGVTVHEPGPIVGRPGDRPIADAVRQAWRNAVAVVAWLIAAGGVVIPAALVVGVAVWAGRRLGIRRRPAAADAA